MEQSLVLKVTTKIVKKRLTIALSLNICLNEKKNWPRIYQLCLNMIIDLLV